MIKTNKSARKRFKITGTGKIKRTKAYHMHILTTKSSKQKRSLHSNALVSHADFNRTKNMLPNG